MSTEPQNPSPATATPATAAPKAAAPQKPDPREQKPYVKLASRLVMTGGALFALEQFTLGQAKAALGGHIDPTILSLLVLVPMGMVAVGAIIFVGGRMMRR